MQTKVKNKVYAIVKVKLSTWKHLKQFPIALSHNMKAVSLYGLQFTYFHRPIECKVHHERAHPYDRW